MIEVVYSNGCSHSAGGGLELSKELDNQKGILVKDTYNKIHGVNWNTQSEVTYIARLAEKLNCEYVNDAASGGGSNRVVRMAYEFVKKNWYRKDKLFLFLEFPAFFSRLDIYSNALNAYLILNQTLNEDGKRIFLYATREYYNNYTLDDFNIVNKDKHVSNYLDSFSNYFVEVEKVKREIETFLSFLELHNIKYIFCEGGKEIQQTLPDSILQNELSIETIYGIEHDFHHWCMQTKQTIKDELNEQTKDLHPGYFAHINFANILYEHIIKKYNI